MITRNQETRDIVIDIDDIAAVAGLVSFARYHAEKLCEEKDLQGNEIRVIANLFRVIRSLEKALEQ